MSDVFNLKTGLNVAGSYHLKFTRNFWVLFVISLLMVAFSFFVKIEKPEKKKRIGYALLFGFLSAGCIVLMQQTEQIYHYTHPYKGATMNGCVYEFVGTADVFLKEPDEYDKEEFSDEELLFSDISKESLPNVLFIMNESFMDPDTYDFGLDIDLIPFLHELQKDENCVSGTMMSSVLGGMTACTEFEAMTGESSYFTGSNVQYTSYMKTGQEYQSLARLFRSLGYTSTAFHPFQRNGYNRETAYTDMGFDNFISMENLTDYQEGVFSDDREYVTDKYDFDKLFDIMESTNSRDFILNVTIQNHGSYDQQSLTDTPKDFTTSIESMDNYLYLITQTDEAMRGFLQKLKSYDEPVVLVFFGDHQPENMINTETGSDLVKYEVPYYIWANFPLNTDIPNTKRTSANYLACILFEALWKKQPNSWYEYLDTLRSTYPSISKNAVYNINDSLVKDTSELKQYERYSYYHIWEQQK